MKGASKDERLVELGYVIRDGEQTCVIAIKAATLLIGGSGVGKVQR
jgi:hypothetical protein